MNNKFFLGGVLLATTLTNVSLCSQEKSYAKDLFLAIRANNIVTLQTILEAHGVVHSLSAAGETPLYEAALYGHRDLAEYLIQKGADVNARDPDGMTPVHLEYGAHIDAQANISSPPLDYALSEGYRNVAEILLNYGADSDVPGMNNMTLLHAKIFDGDQGMVDLLLQHGADVHAVTESCGHNTLHYAVKHDRLNMIPTLLAYSANIDAVDNEGKTALALALEYGHTEIAKELVKRYASIGRADLDKVRGAMSVPVILGELARERHDYIKAVLDDRGLGMQADSLELIMEFVSEL